MSQAKPVEGGQEGGQAREAATLRERAGRVMAPAVPRVHQIVFSHGSGNYLFDVEGRRYLDFNCGVAVAAVGHGHPEVVRAVQDQAACLLHANTSLGYAEPQIALLESVVAHAPGELRKGKGVLVNSGAEAVDTALRLVRQVTRRPAVLSFLGDFHGRTLAAASVTTSRVGIRTGNWAQMSGVVHAPFPVRGQAMYPGTDPAQAEAIAIETIERLLGPVVPAEDLAAVIVEPLQGEGGYKVPTDGFFAYLRQLCDRTGALLVADEVQTGLGRTGRWFGLEHWGVVPDVMCLAKALGGGLPLGAVLARPEVVERWPVGGHTTTFGGNPLACRAGVKTLEIIERDGLVENARRVGERLMGWLRDGAAGLPQVTDVRGKGLAIAVELRRADGSPAVEEADRSVKLAAERGVMVVKGGAHAIRVAPPLTITSEEAQDGAERLLESIGEACR